MLASCLGIAVACSESSGPHSSSVVALSVIGDNQQAPAGTTVSSPISIVPRDASGDLVKDQTARFSVSAGGGTIASDRQTAGADGTITAPAWTLGKSAIPQELQVTIGSSTATIHSTVSTNFAIDLRFVGPEPTPQQQTLFTDAVARIQGAIVGALPPVDFGAVGTSPCGITAITPPTGTTNALVIYAQLEAFDGVGGILGGASRCSARSSTDLRTAVGVVSLDFADVNLNPDKMRIVALHEMLHILGFGVVWQDAGLISGFDTPNSAYVGSGGIAGCRQAGGTKTCASTVPLETLGGPGTANGHWRDAVFGAELMTAFFHPNPALSVMTIHSFEDLGYSVNASAADQYTIPSDNATNLQQGIVGSAVWEIVHPPLRSRSAH